MSSNLHHWLWMGIALAVLLEPDHVVKARAAAEQVAHRSPRLFPDYSGTVIPPNLAPLNFMLQEPGERFRVRIFSRQGNPIDISSRKPAVIIPQQPWQELLRANAGQELYFQVSVQDRPDQWTRFDPVTNSIAREEIDGYLVYRLLKPLYNTYAHIGIYQRNLHDYEVKEVLHNRSIGQDCINCHTFLNNRPDSMVLQIRGREHGKPMLLVQGNQAAQVINTTGYSSWHPSGRLIAFSVNKFSQFFHTLGETREVFDAKSNLSIYRVDSNSVVTPPVIALPDRLETWPAWSPDGRFLYFCSAPQMDQKHFREVRYDLMRVSYDLDRDAWGQPETLVSARDSGLSATEPKVSPDGRFLLFCLCNYGNFPIFQPSCDLYLMELKTGRYRRLDINSDQCDSWHSWSSNSRWVVFSSKRLDGVFAKPFFTYVDEQGRFHKPLLLPQKDPAFYDAFIKTFNVPELIREPIRVSPRDLARAVVAPRTVLKPKTYGSQPPREPPGSETPGDEDGRYQQVPK